MDWSYRGTTQRSVPDGYIGFVYVLHYNDGSYYVGKKLAITIQKRPPLAAELRKRKNAAKRKVVVKLKWRNYEGSTDHSEGKVLIHKEIITWCRKREAMAYIEMDLQIRMGVLFDPLALNRNILGKFYPNILEGEDFGTDSLHQDGEEN
ncbi:MAG: hypothetical protein KAH01_04150 [Caldisericia bacterium]|nr:hypothetical protein [Caldisericia bacterium]